MEKVRIGRTGRNPKGCRRGILAARDLRRGEPILTVKGTLLRSTYDAHYRMGAPWLAVGRRRWIKPTQDCLWRFINHSCKPNAGLRGRTVVALRDIFAGEEVSIDYAITEEDPYWKMSCRCGNRGCRRTIRSIQFLPAATFRRYLPFIPGFLRVSYAQARLTNHGEVRSDARVRRFSQP